MKKRSRAIIPAVAAGAVILVSVYGANLASANGGYGQDSLAERLVSRFNLNKDDVQKVFEENRTAMQTQRRSEVEERLDQAVSEGKLTEDQKNALLSKMDEMRAKRESLSSDLSREERRAKMAEYREEMQNWSKDNGIDFQALGVFLGRGYGNGQNN